MRRKAGLSLARVLVLIVVMPCILARPELVFRVPEVSVRPISGTKSVGIGPTNSSRINDSERNDVDVQYEEYFVEHEVSTGDAKEEADSMMVEFIPDTLVGCGKCTPRELEYCETRVLADHCCCERQQFPEPFPFMPHTCYVGPHRCKPLAQDCVKYARLRDCCCYKRLATKWKGILSKSNKFSTAGLTLLVLSMVLFAAHL